MRTQQSKRSEALISLTARFLLVSTFLEDSVRILVQFSEQVHFLVHYRGFAQSVAPAFLLAVVALMIGGSTMAIAKFRTTVACSLLMAVVVLQALGYGLMLNLQFMLRNASLIGAVLMLLSESMQPARRKSIFPGLPVVTERGKAKYITLLGRVMLICLFLSISLGGELSVLRILFALVSLVSSVFIIVGFKAKHSAVFLLGLLSVANLFLNNFWALHDLHPNRDYLKYDFFQTLSVIGGLLLLVNVGPGLMSIDEKKKEF